jgi:hypothetical protein
MKIKPLEIGEMVFFPGVTKSYLLIVSTYDDKPLTEIRGGGALSREDAIVLRDWLTTVIDETKL